MQKPKKRIDVGLRVNPNVDAQTHKKISTGRFEISLVYLKQRLCKFLKNTKTTNL